MVVDRVGLAAVARVDAHRAIVDDEQDGRERHRQGDDDGEDAAPLARDDVLLRRDAEDDERELAALREERRELPALLARDVSAGRSRRRPKSIDMPMAMKKRPMRRPLNGSMSVSSACRYSELARSEHEQEREDGEQPAERRAAYRPEALTIELEPDEAVTRRSPNAPRMQPATR